ncbi:uncharacterized protein LOC128808875 isoform X4 [Vidua macroura]|uniref:uncharacterized protein LOC128808875 isoform X4 n=1 Tax=Vidua macroura TaxID=187451 RepID=UPI0023A85EE2|nr:uncharacterized protein LOC128808875 isoform X4 [Vidua macroura]
MLHMGWGQPGWWPQQQLVLSRTKFPTAIPLCSGFSRTLGSQQGSRPIPRVGSHLPAPFLPRSCTSFSPQKAWEDLPVASVTHRCHQPRAGPAEVAQVLQRWHMAWLRWHRFCRGGTGTAEVAQARLRWHRPCRGGTGPAEVAQVLQRWHRYCRGGTGLAEVAQALQRWHRFCRGGTGPAEVAQARQRWHRPCRGGTGSAEVAQALQRWHRFCRGGTGPAEVAHGLAEVAQARQRWHRPCRGGTGPAEVAQALQRWHRFCRGGTGSAEVAQALQRWHRPCRGGTGPAEVAQARLRWHRPCRPLAVLGLPTAAYPGCPRTPLHREPCPHAPGCSRCLINSFAGHSQVRESKSPLPSGISWGCAAAAPLNTLDPAHPAGLSRWAPAVPAAAATTVSPSLSPAL